MKYGLLKGQQAILEIGAREGYRSLERLVQKTIIAKIYDFFLTKIIIQDNFFWELSISSIPVRIEWSRLKIAGQAISLGTIDIAIPL